MKKYVWLAIVGVGVLCIALFYYMFFIKFWNLSDDGTLTIMGKEEMPDYNYYFGERAPWHSERGKIRKIIIEDGVPRIGSDAFFGCSSLKSITIPKSVTEIGWGAFAGCSGLKSVTIPDSVKEIGKSTFRGCSGLKSVTIPKSVTEIGENAFDDCSGLKSVTIPNSVKVIRELAFYGCSSLKTINITDLKSWCGIDFFGSDANPLFYAKHLYLNGKEIDNLVIPNGVTEIGWYAFEYCSGLKSVTIPNSVKEIGKSAFNGCI